MRASIGLDVGTTSVKAVVVAESGEVVSESASGPLSMRAPHSGWAVESTSELQEAVLGTLRSVCGPLPSSIEVVSLAAAVQSGSLVTVSRSGVISDDLATWMDSRSAPLVEQWHSDGTAQLIRDICGWTVQPGQGLPQLAWSRATKSEDWATLGRVASADDLVSHWLTGQWVTNPSNAAGMALMEIRSGEWSQQLCSLVDLSTTQLSELRPSGAAIGNLSPEVAQTVGLPESVTVVNGGHDQACTALALDVAESTKALLAGGTAWVLTTVIQPQSMAEVPSEMNVSFHVAPGLRTASQYLGGMGASMEWWLSNSRSESSRRDQFAALDAELARTVTTDTSPYFRPANIHSGDHQTPGAGHFESTSATTSGADRARSIMEYAAFRVKTTLQNLPTAARPTHLTVVGGATRSPGWTQLIADLCEIPVTETSIPTLPALGAAVIAGVAAELYPNYPAATASIAVSSTEIQANKSQSDLYRRRYALHLQQETQT
ncbi:MAG: FGGY-family carbohydrate kinase [Acidimicrobiales bacterium]